MGVFGVQNRITKSSKFLNENGEFLNKGYATSLLLEYCRHDIKAKGYRIKEWDYYLMTNDECGVALTIADNSYIALISVSFLEFKNPLYKTTSSMNKRPLKLEISH